MFKLRPRLAVFISLLGILIAMAACSGCGRTQSPSGSAAIESERYYAVLLSNGSVYFGKLEGFGTPTPVLRDVYYVQSSTNPDTKQVNSVLVKRGKEWHAPDRMILNEKSIVFVEPVGTGSKVAQLIAESKTK
jgi:hypothetical protein